jgi:hypothetical protein
VVDLVDFFPRPKSTKVMTKGYKQNAFREATKVQEELKKWLVRRVECIRGQMTLGKPSSIPSYQSISRTPREQGQAQTPETSKLTRFK